MDYISIKQLSDKWGLSTRRIQILCRDGRIPGAMRIANTWAVPLDAEKPKDARIKSGRYIKDIRDAQIRQSGGKANGKE